MSPSTYRQHLLLLAKGLVHLNTLTYMLLHVYEQASYLGYQVLLAFRMVWLKAS